MAESPHTEPDADELPGREANRQAPESVEEALVRASIHSRIAVGEALRAARALVDAASLALRQQSADGPGWLGELGRALDRLGDDLAGTRGDEWRPLVRMALETLDREIAHWQSRSHQDAEARAVLRAFLGLREVLWELGLRPDPRPSRAAAVAPDEAPETPPGHEGSRRVLRAHEGWKLSS